jgi:hypothetical protein
MSWTTRRYPPIAQWRDTPRTAEHRLWLADFVRFAKGDPRLTAWEANFLLSIQRLAETPGAPLPSVKQAKLITALIFKITEPFATEDDLDGCSDDGC